MDILFIAVTLGFFALCWGLVVFSAYLMRA